MTGDRFRARRDEGAAAVEMSLVLPLLILLIFGIIEFGILFSRLQGVHAASREAARLGSLVDVSLDDILGQAEQHAPPFLDLDDLSLTVERSVILSNGTETTDATWSWDPVADSWTPAGSGATSPCDRSLWPQPNDPPEPTDVVTLNIRVELQLLNPDDYGVTIPLLGGFAFAHPSEAEFRCEYSASTR